MFKPTTATLSYCAYELGVHAFLKSDLVEEVMYNGKVLLYWDLIARIL